MRAPASRNAPCPCGSGRRYKNCHGALAETAGASAPVAASPAASGVDRARALEVAKAGLDAQLARELGRAEQLYREALALDPSLADAWHMLGVVRMECGAASEALGLIRRALDLTDWQYPEFLHNFGLALARAMSGGGPPDLGIGPVGRAYRSRGPEPGRLMPSNPLVSILVPVYNHAAYLDAAFESVFAQTYRHCEIVAIDDGSSDDSAARLAALARRSPFPFRWRARANLGAARTLDELVHEAQGDWLHPLNSDDHFAPDRIERMLEAVVARGARWGFGAVCCIDTAGATIDPLVDPRVFEFRCAQSAIGFGETVGEAFLSRNVAISTGNLFFERTLFERVGGFVDSRWHHDWLFCLAALFESEPAWVPEAIYFYRLHARNTIAESHADRLYDLQRGLPPLLDRLFEGEAPNPWAPNVRNWGPGFVSRLLSGGIARFLHPERLHALAEPWLGTLPENTKPAPA